MIAELAPPGAMGHRVRIPPELDVPLTPRVARLVDTAALRRLGRITQLGLVHLVYPGATHSRLEHSLGVYRNALLVLGGLMQGPGRERLQDDIASEAFVVAALLHDAGHWPFCHAIEDLGLGDVPRHETRVAELVAHGDVAEAIRRDWHCSGDDVMSLLLGREVGASRLNRPTIELLASCLSGPIDIDKLDYLVRDSLHAGVPYGRHFDASRLVGAMTVDPQRGRLAITEKGRTAAEMMVFARYVMFSEVYWHHAVRSATAMLQRSVQLLHQRVDFTRLMSLDEPAWIESWRQAAQHAESEQAEARGVSALVEGLFGRCRRLYKRVSEFSASHGSRLHGLLAHRPYWWLVACSEQLGRRVAEKSGLSLGPCDILIDAPPVKLEVDINVAMVAGDGQVFRLADVSPVAEALAQRQFDSHVKRVRIFVRPELRNTLKPLLTDPHLVGEVVQSLADETV